MSTVTPERAPAAAPPRPPRPPGRLRRAGALLAGLALAAAAVALQSAAPEPGERGAPLTSTGRVGDEVAASRFTARVEAVHAARSVEIADAAGAVETATTSGIFVVVEAAATAHREPQKFGRPVLLSGDGKRYTATDKVDSTLDIAYPYVQPGWWTEGVAVFDVPVTALTGSRIVLAPGGGGFIGEAYPPEAEIDLGLDDAGTQRLIAAAKDVHRLEARR
ncbi:hypothetical protein [Planomonospora venezuelensis]|uniref:DUF4352 domain-containing protein n=1 Tax=Planomonospora venezuelensis TaxID=1999 RepID=A0A841CVS9_PLAVE|nr:hypothetical protein [Planomonospora venezuelensis]MBB5961419.1 hypothetical protein [Planomonospora venezuelensis]GIN03165.1 hypothetical protein Pve01_48230 [Planomonospora venezuelensis]